jgi:hypothetical protein
MGAAFNVENLTFKYPSSGEDTIKGNLYHFGKP